MDAQLPKMFATFVQEALKRPYYLHVLRLGVDIERNSNG